MAANQFIFVILVEALVIGGLTLLYPRIARRGLLFGVYVGEEQWDDEDARLITKSWQHGVVLLTVISFGLGLAVFLRYPNPAIAAMVVAISPLALTVGTVGLFLRAYLRARTMAAPGLPPPAVAVLAAPETPLTFPILVLVAGILCGIFTCSYAAAHFAELPAQVPTHFGPSGRPDVWRPKSFWTVMLLPLLTLVMGGGMGATALLIGRAKRAIRFPQTQVSIEAQMRFRQAFTRYLSCLALAVAALLVTGSVGSIRVGLGMEDGFSPLMMVFGVVLGALAVGDTLYLALRYGQGGARLERSAGNAPLTNGLADNRYWVLGAFYVNRNDPSIFVERRFGFGYTINFGNPKAVAFFFGFILLILALAGAAIVKG